MSSIEVRANLIRGKLHGGYHGYQSNKLDDMNTVHIDHEFMAELVFTTKFCF